MPIRKCLKYINLLLCLAFSLNFGQQLNFKTFGSNEGIPDPLINKLFIDNNGLLVIGTYNGIAFFDGIEFKIHNSTNGISKDIILSISQDAKGLYYAGTSAGLNKLENGKYSLVENISGNRINALHKTGDKIWAGTEKGLNLIENGVAVDFNEKAMTQFFIRSLASDRYGNLWIGGIGKVWHKDDGGLKEVLFEKNVFEENPVHVFVDKLGKVWAALGKNLYYFNGVEFEKYPADFQISRINCIYEDYRGHFWIGADRGVIRITGKNFVHYNSLYMGGIVNEVRTIVEDREQNLWLGTDVGLMLFRGENLLKYNALNDMKYFVWSMFQETNGDILIGTDGFGLKIFRDDKFNDYNNPDLKGESIWCMAKDTRGRIWMGTNNGIFAKEGNNIIRPVNSQELNSQMIINLYEDRRGNMWIASYRNGIYRFNGFELKHISEEDGLAERSVHCFSEDRYGNVFLGSDAGLQIINSEGRIVQIPEYDNYVILSMIMIGDDLWMGTNGRGVIHTSVAEPGKYDRITQYDSKNGLNNDIVMFLCKGRNGFFAGTNAGINDINLSEFKTKNIVNILPFNEYDNFGGLETTQGSGFVDNHGRLWAGTTDGLVVYDPTKNVNRPVENINILRGLKIFFEDRDISEYGIQNPVNHLIPLELELPYNYNHITFEFSGLNYANPTYVRYKYMLEGADEKYSPATNKNNATYSNLPPGEYTFKLISCNRYNIWSSEPLEYKFSIKAPFWRTYWFYFILLTIAAGILYYAYRWRMKNVIEKNEQLNKLLRTKTEYEEKLKQSEKDYKGLFENAYDPILIFDPVNHTIIDANLSALNMYGYSAEEMKGMQVEELVYNFDNAKANIDYIIRNTQLRFMETSHISKDGSILELELNAVLVSYSGKQAILAMYRDITERKKIEAQLRQAKEQAEKTSKLKSEFLAQMSHEIRTPINSILSFTSMIKSELQSSLDEYQLESFDYIEHGSRRLIRTVDSILNMSQIQSGTFEIHPKKVILSELLPEIIKDFKTSAEQKNLQIKYRDLSEQAGIWGDPYSLTQIFVHLIENSVKYTEKGMVSVSIVREGNKKLWVEIADTGIGISPEYRNKLFSPFSQEDEGFSRKYEGNGLGLALVKKFCEFNEAEITLHSEKGLGTSIKITFNSLG